MKKWNNDGISPRLMIIGVAFIVGMAYFGIVAIEYSLSADEGTITDKLLEGDVVIRYYFEIDGSTIVEVNLEDFNEYIIGDNYTFYKDKIVGG